MTSSSSYFGRSASSSLTYTSPSDFQLVTRYAWFRCKTSTKRCLSCRYFRANIVYLLYCAIAMYVDLYVTRERAVQSMYVLLGYIHILNALMYLWMWSEVRSVASWYIMPDWINMVNSLLYWTSGWLYAFEYNVAGEQTKYYFFTRRLDLFAGSLDMVAAFGWMYQWYAEFVTDLALSPEYVTIGRGFTLDDPDVWANLTLVLGAGYYLQYNATVYLDPSQYEDNYLYVVGDFWYLVNAVLYTVCSMRDAECFWFMPCNGRLQDYAEAARLHYFSSATTTAATATGSSRAIQTTSPITSKTTHTQSAKHGSSTSAAIGTLAPRKDDDYRNSNGTGLGLGDCNKRDDDHNNAYDRHSISSNSKEILLGSGNSSSSGSGTSSSLSGVGIVQRAVSGSSSNGSSSSSNGNNGFFVGGGFGSSSMLPGGISSAVLPTAATVFNLGGSVSGSGTDGNSSGNLGSEAGGGGSSSSRGEDSSSSSLLGGSLSGGGVGGSGLAGWLVGGSSSSFLKSTFGFGHNDKLDK